MPNIFGGGNKNSLYVPMSEDEQEVLERIQGNHSMIVKIIGWGQVRPVVGFGDKRVALYLDLKFDGPEHPVPVHSFQLELWNEGVLLYKDQQLMSFAGKPTMVAAGVSLGLVWDIAIGHMDPAWVKRMKPGSNGMTSRVLDPVTGKMTLAGNMTLTEDHMAILHRLRVAEAQSNQVAQQNLQKKMVEAPKAPVFEDPSSPLIKSED